MLFNGIEVDVLSIGDADCIVLTQWNESYPHRVLIDGGSGANAEAITDFLIARGYFDFWAVVCTHLHNDHARGLIKLLQNKAFTFRNGWMHDIRKHVGIDALRRASRSDDGVKEVVETTDELSRAFAGRRISVTEPFTGWQISHWPFMTVLGPSLTFYKKTIEEFTKQGLSLAPPPPLWRAAATVLGGQGLPSLIPGVPPQPRYTTLSSLIPPPTRSSLALPLPPLTGALKNSSVKKNPSTQPYNNTSVILGVTLGNRRLMLTADAGTDALAHVPAIWNHLLYMGIPHHGSDGNLSQADIERFCPEFAVISAKGDASHPSRAIVSGLVKVGTKVASTHQHGNVWFWFGNVPARTDYKLLEPLKGTGSPEPTFDWLGHVLRRTGA